MRAAFPWVERTQWGGKYFTIRKQGNMKIRLFFSIAALLCAWAAGAQTRRTVAVPSAPSIEQLPCRPLDTLSTDDPETKIVLYTNNTWSYLRPACPLDSLPVYARHWDTSQVFAYKSIAYDDLPSAIELNLVHDLSGFHAPIVGNVVSKYGPRRRRNHNGADIPLRVGEPIYASFDGKVRYAKYNTGGFGYLVILRHPNGLETWHAHLSRINVAVNEYVKAGQVIGFGGNTGRSRGPHLHFEMRYCDQTFDPEFIVDFPTGSLKYQTFALEKSFFNIHSRASEILEEDDDDDFPLLASAEGDSTLTSEQILERIAATQQPDKPKQASLSANKSVYHTVRSGDILGRLAIKYGVSVKKICDLNGIKPTTTLRIGQKLRIR